MKITQGDELEWVRGLEYRGGTFHYRHLLNGTPGTIRNFQFDIGQTEGDFASARHRHNFDQFRFAAASGPQKNAPLLRGVSGGKMPGGGTAAALACPKLWRFASALRIR